MQKLNTNVRRMPAVVMSGLMATFSMVAHAQSQDKPVPVRSPGVELALEAAKTAVATCTTNGYNVSVTVIDAAGVTRLIYANDKAGSGAIDSATRKAYTSLQFKEATAEVAAHAATDQALAAKINADPKMFARAGGFPLIAGSTLVGAIGVGGAPGGEKDAVCAQAGVDQIQSHLK